MNKIYLLRHGQTEWSAVGKHTSITDLDLTTAGHAQSAQLAHTITTMELNSPIVISSPRLRAKRTAQLAGLSINTIDDRLVEWNYGEYEGITSSEIRQKYDPDWTIWTGYTPGGETQEQVIERARQVFNQYCPLLENHDIFLVGHGHFSRVLLTTWLGIPLATAQHFAMEPASIACLSTDRGIPIIEQLGKR